MNFNTQNWLFLSKIVARLCCETFPSVASIQQAFYLFLHCLSLRGRPSGDFPPYPNVVTGSDLWLAKSADYQSNPPLANQKALHSQRRTSADSKTSILHGPYPCFLCLLRISTFRWHYRSTLSMPKDRVRPHPVSCQTCRSKKLKCNRVQPCSNCTARGINCTFLVPPQGPADTNSSPHSNAELLERIRRLESIILQQRGPIETHSTYAADNSSQQSWYPSPGSVIVSDVHQKRDNDSQFLESLGRKENSCVCGPNLSTFEGLLPALNLLTTDTFLLSRTICTLE